MGKHAKASPSKLKQILGCTASLDAEAGFPDEESTYAAEGTALHAMAEHLIKKHLKICTRRPNSDYYTDENLEAVDEYVSAVCEAVGEAHKVCRDPMFDVEHRVDLSTYVGDCFGTADMVIVTDTKVHIFDLKMGQGIPVYAEDNPQLMAYGLGILSEVEMLYPIETVELTIVQPRLQSYSTWEIGVEELKAWGRDVFVPKVAEALEHRGSFHPGTETCRFCKARFQCRARAEFFLEVARLEFRQPELLTDEEMADVLLKADALKKWVEEVYAYAQNEAVENHKEWPGFKIVRGKSNRKYTDEDAVSEAAKAAGFEDIYKMALIGITEMERLMGKKKFSEILGGLVYKPEGKLVLVPETDRREAYKHDTAREDFAE